MTRIFDILLATLGLVILSPLLIFVYVAIVLESRGGGFYRQERTGRYGKPFRLIKVRSMNVNADKHGLITVGGHDNRITRVGYYIRKYKIDELPQLINVVKGDMSIVGPRPALPREVVKYDDYQRQRLLVQPG